MYGSKIQVMVLDCWALSRYIVFFIIYDTHTCLGVPNNLELPENCKNCANITLNLISNVVWSVNVKTTVVIWAIKEFLKTNRLCTSFEQTLLIFVLLLWWKKNHCLMTLHFAWLGLPFKHSLPFQPLLQHVA